MSSRAEEGWLVVRWYWRKQWKRGRSSWLSRFVPNVGFSRTFSRPRHLSSDSQWSELQTLEILSMPLQWHRDWSGQGTINNHIPLSLLTSIECKSWWWCLISSVIFSSLLTGISRKIHDLVLCWLLIVTKVQIGVKFSLLTFPSFHPSCSGSSRKPLFQLNREQTERACCLPMKATTVWLTM